VRSPPTNSPPSTNYELAARLRRAFDAATIARTDGRQRRLSTASTTRVAELATQRPLVVITNKPTPAGPRVLKAAGLLPFFEACTAPDTPPQRKPSPLLLASGGERDGRSACTAC